MTERRRPASGSFPPGFVWGAATSAYQIEGSPRVGGKGESIWDRFVSIPGNIAGGATGDVAGDHYRRARSDVGLMADIGLMAYRFSIAWTRVQPDGKGPGRESGLRFYERLVDDLLEAGIQPWITLYHWDLPQALEDRGGWLAAETAAAFAKYTDLVTRRLGDRVKRWITINEPWEIGFMGYGSGQHAPGHADLGYALSAVHTALVAHGQAVEVIRTNVSQAQVGLAIDLVECYPDRDDPLDTAAVARMDGHFNRWFLDPLAGLGYPGDMVAAYGEASPIVLQADLAVIATPVDFVGLNYYYSNWVRAGAGSSLVERVLQAQIVDPHVSARTGIGWAVHPPGFEQALTRLAAAFPSREIIVTESGAAFADPQVADGLIDDRERSEYHADYLAVVERVIRQGVPVGGYFVWSLLDNFEWAQGYDPRFGLIGVDFASQVRTIKSSGHWYGEVIRTNSIVPWQEYGDVLPTSTDQET